MSNEIAVSQHGNDDGDMKKAINAVIEIAVSQHGNDDDGYEKSYKCG